MTQNRVERPIKSISVFMRDGSMYKRKDFGAHPLLTHNAVEFWSNDSTITVIPLSNIDHYQLHFDDLP